jgi:hypothetical protein
VQELDAATRAECDGADRQRAEVHKAMLHYVADHLPGATLTTYGFKRGGTVKVGSRLVDRGVLKGVRGRELQVDYGGTQYVADQLTGATLATHGFKRGGTVKVQGGSLKSPGEPRREERCWNTHGSRLVQRGQGPGSCPKSSLLTIQCRPPAASAAAPWATPPRSLRTQGHPASSPVLPCPLCASGDVRTQGTQGHPAPLHPLCASGDLLRWPLQYEPE